MKIILTQDEFKAIILKAIDKQAPEGKIAVVKVSEYSTDYCTVTFKDKESDDDKSTIDDTPIDLSEIPF